MSNEKLNDEKRYIPTFREKKHRNKIKIICKIVIFLGVGLAAFAIWYAIGETNEGLSYAESLYDFLKIAVGTIVLGMLGCAITLFSVLKSPETWMGKYLRAILGTLVAVLFFYLFLGLGLTAYASHKIGDYKAKAESEETEHEPVDQPDQPQSLKKFEWTENIYVFNLEEYLGEGADESEIEGLLLTYLEDSIELVEINKEKYEEYIDNSQGFHQDFTNATMTETKIFAADKEAEEREKANKNYSDSDNLKLYADCHVNLGNLQPSQKVEFYEEGVRAYIEALHIVYQYGEERSSEIEEKDIWKAKRDTYGKLSMSSDIQ